MKNVFSMHVLLHFPIWEYYIVIGALILAQRMYFNHYGAFSWEGEEIKKGSRKTLIVYREEVLKASSSNSAWYQRRHQRNEEGKKWRSLNKIWT